MILFFLLYTIVYLLLLFYVFSSSSHVAFAALFTILLFAIPFIIFIPFSYLFRYFLGESNKTYKVNGFFRGIWLHK